MSEHEKDRLADINDLLDDIADTGRQINELMEYRDRQMEKVKSLLQAEIDNV